MAPTSTVTRRRVRKHPLFRFGPPVLAALMAIPFAAFVITRGGSTGDREVALEPVADHQELLVAPPAPTDRVSRAAPRWEETGSSTTSTTAALVEVTRVTEERVIPTPKERRDDPDLPWGETRVEADGAPGLERVVFEVTRTNGRITAKRKISSEVITPARPRVVYVGRGGGRGAPTDEGVLKLRIAAAEPSAPAPARRQEGGASWYRYKPGTCAHRSIAKGTVVTVTNLENGKTTTCTVADRGPFIAGRIIDLERGVFMAIARSPGQGVMRVRIEW